MSIIEELMQRKARIESAKREQFWKNEDRKEISQLFRRCYSASRFGLHKHVCRSR